MKKYFWNALDRRTGHIGISVSVYAKNFKQAEERICELCNKHDLTPTEYVGWCWEDSEK